MVASRLYRIAVPLTSMKGKKASNWLSLTIVSITPATSRSLLSFAASALVKAMIVAPSSHKDLGLRTQDLVSRLEVRAFSLRTDLGTPSDRGYRLSPRSSSRDQRDASPRRIFSGAGRRSGSSGTGPAPPAGI